VLEIELECLEPEIRAFVGFRLRRTDGVIVSGDDSRRTTDDFRFVAGQDRVTYRIDRLDVLVGNYDIEVAVFRSGTVHTIDHVIHAGRFEVLSGHEVGQSGSVAMFGRFDQAAR
jgi:hypothetical protein